LHRPPPAPQEINADPDCTHALCFSLESAQHLIAYISNLQQYADEAWGLCGERK
jgi:hypothetical protein